ncbi:MAG: HD domain-containing phosphohydrolase, partial [Planctomycetota bacterium]
AATSTAKEEHVYAAEKLLSQIPDLGDVLPAIKYHHERTDGTGFPYQIKEMPVIAKIISVSNTLDNLVTRGGVKGIGLPIRDALTEIEHQSGKEFDPGVVNALIASYNDGSLFKSTKLFEDSL